MCGSPAAAFTSRSASIRGVTFRVTAMTSGAVGQLVPAQAAQSKVGICRERQNLALPAGFFLSWKASPRCAALLMTGLPHVASAAAATLSCS